MFKFSHRPYLSVHTCACFAILITHQLRISTIRTELYGLTSDEQSIHIRLIINKLETHFIIRSIKKENETSSKKWRIQNNDKTFMSGITHNMCDFVPLNFVKISDNPFFYEKID